MLKRFIIVGAVLAALAIFIILYSNNLKNKLMGDWIDKEGNIVLSIYKKRIIFNKSNINVLYKLNPIYSIITIYNEEAQVNLLYSIRNGKLYLVIKETNEGVILYRRNYEKFYING